jgi:DNA-binding IclR family transcriptional regulator
VAVCDPAGYPVAGIGTTYITGMLDKTRQQHHLELMQQAAINISRWLFVADEDG